MVAVKRKPPAQDTAKKTYEDLAKAKKSKKVKYKK
tara:strand:- start:2064 stop:2168 length:105 start_codon:yes stop_codon:yes gene_type:complete